MYSGCYGPDRASLVFYIVAILYNSHIQFLNASIFKSLRFRGGKFGRAPPLLYPRSSFNVPRLSERTRERDIVNCGISMGSEVQVGYLLIIITDVIIKSLRNTLVVNVCFTYDCPVTMLDAAAASNPDSRWWLKGDGCDLVTGLGEPVCIYGQEMWI